MVRHGLMKGFGDDGSCGEPYELSSTVLDFPII